MLIMSMLSSTDISPSEHYAAAQSRRFPYHDWANTVKTGIIGPRARMLT